MKKKALLSALTSVLSFVVTLSAQVPADSAISPSVADTNRSLADGLKLRSDAVASIASGESKPEQVIERLKLDGSPTGLKLDPDADFALAAIDVGQRLVTLKKPAEAEKFFHEAERSLEQVLRKTPDSASQDKALLLRKLAFIRSQYLNKVAQAKSDIEQAIKLQPDDKGLKRAKEMLPNDSAELLKNKIKG